MWYRPKIPIFSYVPPGAYATEVGINTVAGGVPYPRRLSLTKPLDNSPKAWTLTLTAPYTSSSTFSPILNTNLPLDSSDWLVEVEVFGGCPWFSSRAFFRNSDLHPFIPTNCAKYLRYVIEDTTSPILTIPINSEKISTSVLASRGGEDQTLQEIGEPSATSEGISLTWEKCDLDGSALETVNNIEYLGLTASTTSKIIVKNWAGKGYTHISWYVYKEEEYQGGYSLSAALENLELNSLSDTYIKYAPLDNKGGIQMLNFCIGCNITGPGKKLNLWCGIGFGSSATPPPVGT